MQLEALPAPAVLALKMIEIERRPALEPVRFALGKAAPHREGGVRQEDRVSIRVRLFIGRFFLGCFRIGRALSAHGGLFERMIACRDTE